MIKKNIKKLLFPFIYFSNLSFFISDVQEQELESQYDVHFLGKEDAASRTSKRSLPFTLFSDPLNLFLPLCYSKRLVRYVIHLIIRKNSYSLVILHKSQVFIVDLQTQIYQTSSQDLETLYMQLKKLVSSTSNESYQITEITRIYNCQIEYTNKTKIPHLKDRGS